MAVPVAAMVDVLVAVMVDVPVVTADAKADAAVVALACVRQAVPLIVILHAANLLVIAVAAAIVIHRAALVAGEAAEAAA